MKPKSVAILQLLLWIVCLFHVGMGLGLNLAPGFVPTVASMYGADVEQWSPQFLYLLKPLGVFMAALGVFAGMAAVDPLHRRATIYVFAGIFAARALQRILFTGELETLFGIDGQRNLINMAFFFGLAAMLIVLDVMSQRALEARQASSV